MKPIQVLQNNFSGEIIMPGDDQYEQASTVVATKGAPAAVVRPRTAADVTPVFMSSNVSEGEMATALKLCRDIAAFDKGAYSNFFSEASDCLIERARSAV